MHIHAYWEMERLVRDYLDPTSPLRVLDVGSLDVNGSHRPLFDRPGWTYQGLDRESGPNVDIVVHHPHRWPIASARYDLVISGQTLEHMPQFWLTWKTMVRVAKPNGLLFLTVPSKGAEHRFPVDCWRFYPDAMQALADSERLELIEAQTRWDTPWGDTIGVFRKRARSASFATWLRHLWPGKLKARPTPVAHPAPTTATSAYARSVPRRTEPIAAVYREAYSQSVADWFRYHQMHLHYDQMRWMGARTLKNPLDCWIYQEILWEVRPRVVVELGSFAGGSTLFLLHMLDLIGEGTVVSVDCDRELFNISHPRLHRIDGDLADPRVRERVAAQCGTGPVLVIHDADHHHASVLRDLRNFGSLVTEGSYLIVEDGIVEVVDGLVEVPPGTEGPLAAVMDFLSESPEFEVDHRRERYLITYNPGSFLRRRALPDPQVRERDLGQ
ncbi:CmcI family methyltransferase [uncultured Thiohalocapsa sp.]|uniref:CmcI family methyltransferase n=1 Tax=uncultured Thiohalocapsa sp. TaxID=768990 RepID=UPI0025DAC91A|nr:CmcI family methyltransferase [uncultured Thiohalocapsa sp.]